MQTHIASSTTLGYRLHQVGLHMDLDENISLPWVSIYQKCISHSSALAQTQLLVSAAQVFLMCVTIYP